MKKISVILLAGGTGSRMKAELPKQYLQLHGKPLIFHSLDIFLKLPEVQEIIIVCDPAYHSLFHAIPKKIRFALPGTRRQDSVYNGLQLIDEQTDLICLHDAARPFITEALVRRVLSEGHQHGAATVGMPLKFTIKETDPTQFVKSTLDRSRIWEIQTPQVIRSHLLKQGFEKANKEGVTVTDDVSLVEIIDHPVKLVEGSYANIKITTIEDMQFAESFRHE